MARKWTTVQHDINVTCQECGAELSADADGDTLNVEPCEKCLDAAREEAAKEARDEATP